MFTIDEEAKKNKISPLSLDFMGDTYKTESGKIVFPSPSLWVFEKHLYFLAANSIRKKFEQKYIMRPDYLSYDEYSTVVLAPLLMYVNSIFNIEDFNMNEVIIPNMNYIIEILVDKFPEISPDNLEVINW